MPFFPKSGGSVISDGFSTNSPHLKSPVLKNFGSDQAAFLRQCVEKGGVLSEEALEKTSMAVLSGKGGVGKTNLVVNLALAAGSRGASVAILDADLGLANVDILFGMMPRYNLSHVISGERALEDVVVTVDENVKIIPGGAGIQSLADLGVPEQEQLFRKLAVLEESVDLFLVDTAAGIHHGVLSFALAVETILLVTTPEPTAIRDAYGVLKALSHQDGGRKKDVRLLVNMASDEEEAHSVAERVQMAASQFLGMDIPYIGYIPWDSSIRKAVQRRRPFYLAYPSSGASRALSSVAERLFSFKGKLSPKEEERFRPGIAGVRGFFHKLMSKRHR